MKNEFVIRSDRHIVYKSTRNVFHLHQNADVAIVFFCSPQQVTLTCRYVFTFLNASCSTHRQLESILIVKWEVTVWNTRMLDYTFHCIQALKGKREELNVERLKKKFDARLFRFLGKFSRMNEFFRDRKAAENISKKINISDENWTMKKETSLSELQSTSWKC